MRNSHLIFFLFLHRWLEVNPNPFCPFFLTFFFIARGPDDPRNTPFPLTPKGKRQQTQEPQAYSHHLGDPTQPKPCYLLLIYWLWFYCKKHRWVAGGNQSMAQESTNYAHTCTTLTRDEKKRDPGSEVVTVALQWWVACRRGRWRLLWLPWYPNGKLSSHSGIKFDNLVWKMGIFWLIVWK